MKNIFRLILLSLLSSILFADESKICKVCHPIIYNEYYKSSHRKASVYNNPFHKAMWDKHPKTKKGYTCAKCHTPSDLKSLETGELTENTIQTQEAISCVYCHTIQSVEHGKSSSTNKLNAKTREFYTAEKGMKGKAEFKTVSSWFGLIKESKSSPYHKIDYSNENYYNGNVCMGCHSHTNNEHSFDISMLDALIDEKDENTCVTCHMPQVLGTKTTINESKTHAYHGMAGIYHQSKKMGQYIDFNLTKNASGFQINVINKSNHALFGQAFRQGILRVEIQRNGKTIELNPFIFERILAKDGKKAMPWYANMTLKDTLIYANKKVTYDKVLQVGDILKLTLGVQRISNEGAKELGLEDNKELTKFRILKTEKFRF